MRVSLLLALPALLLSASAAAQPEPTPADSTAHVALPDSAEFAPSHLEAAEALLALEFAAGTFEREARATIEEQVALNPSIAPFAETVTAFTLDVLSWENVRGPYALLYAEAFTEEELGALAAFYGTAVGQKLLRVVPDVVAQRDRVGEAMALARQDELRERVFARMEALGLSPDAAPGSAVAFPDPPAETGGPEDLAEPDAPVQASDPESVAAALEAAGYPASLQADAVGDPLIASTFGGLNWVIYFYGCTDGVACRSVQFTVGFDMEEGSDGALVESWNATKRFGKASLDDAGNPSLRYDLLLAGDGVSRAYFVTTVNVWGAIITEFAQHMGW